MNHTQKDTIAFLEGLKIDSKTNSQMRLYVPYLNLETALKKAPKGVQIGAQNVHFEKSGAFTAEVSGSMLKEIGVNQVLIGHSERRQYFNETNETVLKRCLTALADGFEVLVCIGETLQERNDGNMNKVLNSQLEQLAANENTRAAFGSKLHIAYEPVWAIGTGVTASPAQAAEAHAFIRNFLKTKISPECANATRILYGGSVTPANFKDLLACDDIDGGLVGGASLKIEGWTQLWNLI